MSGIDASSIPNKCPHLHISVNRLSMFDIHRQPISINIVCTTKSSVEKPFIRQESHVNPSYNSKMIRTIVFWWRYSKHFSPEREGESQKLVKEECHKWFWKSKRLSCFDSNERPFANWTFWNIQVGRTSIEMNHFGMRSIACILCIYGQLCVCVSVSVWMWNVIITHAM